MDLPEFRLIQSSLEPLARQRTTIVRNADRIIVLTEQGIAEQGTHEELTRQNGVYAQMQALGMRL